MGNNLSTRRNMLVGDGSLWRLFTESDSSKTRLSGK